MIPKTELHAKIIQILTSIYENKEDECSVSEAHIHSGIKNIHSQNFEEYILQKMLKENGIMNISDLPIVNQIKKFYSNHKIYENNAYFDSHLFTLDENIIYVCKNMYGTQSPPDFTLLIHGYLPILMEAKSSKKKCPLWNCSLPNPKTIYLFYSGSYNRVFIHLKYHILDDETEVILRDLHQQIKELVNQVHETKIKGIKTDKKWDFYPRPMYNQKFDYDISQITSYFQDVIEKIEDMLSLNPLLEKSCEVDELSKCMGNLKM